MDIGLYSLKYPARKLLKWTLPQVKNVNPNTVSWMLLPVGAGIAVCFSESMDNPSLFLFGSFLSLLRMFLGTLDGLMAVHFKKESAVGEMINRLTPEICDAMYLTALAMAKTEWLYLGMIALVIAWLTSFAGLLGILSGKSIQSVGPAGQTDRLAAFMLFSCLNTSPLCKTGRLISSAYSCGGAYSGEL